MLSFFSRQFATIFVLYPLSIPMLSDYLIEYSLPTLRNLAQLLLRCLVKFEIKFCYALLQVSYCLCFTRANGVNFHLWKIGNSFVFGLLQYYWNRSNYIKTFAYII